MPLITETPRLIVRTWELEDVDALCALTREEGISEFSVSGYADYSQEKAKIWIQKEQDRFARSQLAKFAVVKKDSNQLIGISGLFQMPPPNDKDVELNYRYPKAHRGQGYAVEAARGILYYGFYSLKLPAIYANVDVKNLASQKVLQKLGMSLVGSTTYEGVQATRWCLKSL